MSSSTEEFLKELWASARRGAQNGRDKIRNEAIEGAYKEGIAVTAAALYEAGVKDTVIINLLQKHWYIHEDEATEYLRLERTVEYPIRALKAYLIGEGLSSRERRTFIYKNEVREKLINDTNLWKLKPAELKDAVEENE